MRKIFTFLALIICLMAGAQVTQYNGTRQYTGTLEVTNSGKLKFKGDDITAVKSGDTLATAEYTRLLLSESANHINNRTNDSLFEHRNIINSKLSNSDTVTKIATQPFVVNYVAQHAGITPSSGLMNWNSVTNQYELYSSKQNFLSFYSGTENPTGFDRLNINGNLFTNGLTVQGSPIDTNYIKFRGNSNSFFGYTAGSTFTTASYTTAVGRSAALHLTTGQGNTCVGSYSGQEITNHNQNTFIGTAAGNNCTASYNTYIGYNCGYANGNFSTGGANTFVGNSSGYSIQSGYSNVFLGVSAGQNITTGHSNVVIGQNALFWNKTAYNSIIIGGSCFYNKKNSINNLLIIDNNTDTTSNFIAGDMNADTLRINARLRIGKGANYSEISTTGKFSTTQSTINIATSQTPASASASGTTGDICWDANYIYICTATNTWKRVAIATW